MARDNWPLTHDETLALLRVGWTIRLQRTRAGRRYTIGKGTIFDFDPYRDFHGQSMKKLRREQELRQVPGPQPGETFIRLEDPPAPTDVSAEDLLAELDAEPQPRCDYIDANLGCSLEIGHDGAHTMGRIVRPTSTTTSSPVLDRH